jgi:hypothetical protein
MSIFDQIEQYGFMPVIAIYAATIGFAAEILSAR